MTCFFRRFCENVGYLPLSGDTGRRVSSGDFAAVWNACLFLKTFGTVCCEYVKCM